jgi:hypothetical protein
MGSNKGGNQTREQQASVPGLIGSGEGRGSFS